LLKQVVARGDQGPAEHMINFMFFVAEQEHEALEEKHEHDAHVKALATENDHLVKRTEGDKLAVSSPRTKIQAMISEFWSSVDLDKDGVFAAEEAPELMRLYLSCPALSFLLGYEFTDALGDKERLDSLIATVLDERIEMEGQASSQPVPKKKKKMIAEWRALYFPMSGAWTKVRLEFFNILSESIQEALIAHCSSFPALCEKLWKALDHNANGQVSQEEFCVRWLTMSNAVLAHPLRERTRQLFHDRWMMSVGITDLFHGVCPAGALGNLQVFRMVPVDVKPAGCCAVNLLDSKDCVVQ